MPAGAPAAETFDVDKFKAEFTTEIMTKVNESVNTTVNGAIKNAQNDNKKQFDGLLAAIEGLKAAPKGTGDGDPNKGGDPKGEPKTIAELNSRIANYETEVNNLKTQAENETKRREQAEKDARESSRVSQFDSVLSGLQFANDRARSQFRNSYLNQIVWDEDGNGKNLIVNTDKGPMDMKGFITNEYKESPHLQPATNRGGAGANGGSPASGSGQFNFDASMTPAQINALPPDQKAAYRAQVASAHAAAQTGGG